MAKIAELSMALKRITDLEAQLSDAKEAARLLWEEVGTELGVPQSKVAQARKPGPRPKGGKSDEKRTLEGLRDIGREAAIDDVFEYVRGVGKEVPKRSVGSYLVQAYKKGLVERVGVGVYRWLGEGDPP